MESQRTSPLPRAVAGRAKTLARHVVAGLEGGELYNQDFLAKIAKIRFVPVHLPAPPQHVDDEQGIYVMGEADPTARQDGSDDGSGDEGEEVLWSGGVALVLYSEAAVPKDSNLVFTAQPVMMEGLVPPQVMTRSGAERGGCTHDLGWGCWGCRGVAWDVTFVKGQSIYLLPVSAPPCALLSSSR